MGRHTSIDDKALLAILEDLGRPASAYEVMDAFPAESRPKPPVAYRALDRLIARGLVHRVESLKAYMACPQPGHKAAAVLAICDRCGSVEEIEDRRLGDMIESWEESAGFASNSFVFELRGLCRACAPGPSSRE
jgi:Fur family zinc uptake transcriptional regulator